MRSNKTLFCTLAALVVFGVAVPVQAGLLPVKVTITPESDIYRWTYGVVLTSDSEIHTGDFFTIYDFGGYLPGTNVQPDGFEFSASFTGPTPGRLAPDDNPLHMNLTWTYVGPDITSGQLGLGNFSANSTSGASMDGFFTAQTHRQVDGRVDSNITPTDLPVPMIPTIPEPATLALMGIGLPLVGAARWLRRNKSA